MHSYYKEKKDIKKGRYLCRTLYLILTNQLPIERYASKINRLAKIRFT